MLMSVIVNTYLNISLIWYQIKWDISECGTNEWDINEYNMQYEYDIDTCVIVINETLTDATSIKVRLMHEYLRMVILMNIYLITLILKQYNVHKVYILLINQRDIHIHLMNNRD